MLTTALIAVAAFFLPIAAGACSPGTMPGVWLAAAMLEVPVCLLLGQPYAFAAAIQSMMFAMIAVTITHPGPSRRQRRQRENRYAEALTREVEDAGPNLVARICNAPGPPQTRRPSHDG